MNFSWRGFPGGDEHWLVRGVCRGLFHRVRSRPVGSTFPGGGVPRRAVFPGEREWGHCLGGTYMVSSLIARRSASDYKSRLSVVYPASMCSTELRALMSSRCVSSLSSTRPGWPCPSSGFRYTGLTWIVITLLIAFATWGSALPLCV